jgi:hypothetical protein
MPTTAHPGAAPSSSSSVDGRGDGILDLHNGRGCHTANDRRQTRQRTPPSFPPRGAMTEEKSKCEKRATVTAFHFPLVKRRQSFLVGVRRQGSRRRQDAVVVSGG